ncbi:MAG: protein-export chaperone SecB [Gammaproteobacteria bacterium]
MSEPLEPRQVVLQKVYIKDASLENPLAPQVFTRQWQPQIDVQVSSALQSLNADQHQVILTVTVAARLEQEVAFLAEVQQAGIFLVKGVANDAERRRVLGTECLSMLFPFAREAVAELVQRGGFPQLLLQAIDFPTLYDEHLRKSEAAAH